MTAEIAVAILGLVCIVLAVLALRSLVAILCSGSGLRSIVRERSKEAAIFLSSISIIAVCVCYLAITDILKDYAGYMLLLPDGQSVQSILPNWVKCELEWAWVLRGGLVLLFSQAAMLFIMLRSTRSEMRTTYLVDGGRWKKQPAEG